MFVWFGRRFYAHVLTLDRDAEAVDDDDVLLRCMAQCDLGRISVG